MVIQYQTPSGAALTWSPYRLTHHKTITLQRLQISPANATALVLEVSGDILVSSLEMDPDNVLPENKGVIEDRRIVFPFTQFRRDYR